jgi:hypothetical protein
VQVFELFFVGFALELAVLGHVRSPGPEPSLLRLRVASKSSRDARLMYGRSFAAPH